jgi:hypothetical protein
MRPPFRLLQHGQLMAKHKDTASLAASERANKARPPTRRRAIRYPSCIPITDYPSPTGPARTAAQRLCTEFRGPTTAEPRKGGTPAEQGPVLLPAIAVDGKAIRGAIGPDGVIPYLLAGATHERCTVIAELGAAPLRSPPPLIPAARKIGSASGVPRAV